MSNDPTTNHQQPVTPESLHPGVLKYLSGQRPEGSVLLDLKDEHDWLAHGLGNAHPSDILTGTHAGSGSSGLALVVPGTVANATHPSLAAGSRVVAAQVVMAEGKMTSAVAWDGELLIDDSPSANRLSDLLARMQELPTAACLTPASWYWAAVWIAELLDFDGENSVEPSDALSWHPAIDPREVSVQPLAELEDLLVARHREHADIVDWGAIRASACHGWLEVGFCPPETARWLDDGSFGRWLAQELPTPWALDVAAHRLLSPACRQLVSALAKQLVAEQMVTERHFDPPDPK